jgi:hypothetical protein
MKDRKRRIEARKRAEDYAPQPLTSLFMYGVVGACLAGLAWAAFANFYDLNPFAEPFWLAAALILAFGGAMALRVARGRRHNAAHRHEYDKMDPGAMQERKLKRKASDRK